MKREDADLKKEVEELREKVRELEETLDAIRSGEVDAIVVSKDDIQQVYTLEGADHPYRALMDNIREGALTLSRTGMILFTNTRFAEMVQLSSEKVLGTSILDHICPEHSRGDQRGVAGDRRRRHAGSVSGSGRDLRSLPGPHLHEPTLLR